MKGIHTIYQAACGITASSTDSMSTWWRHQMETFSALLAICAGNSPVSGEFPTQRPVTRSFDVFFDVRLIQRLSKHRSPVNSHKWPVTRKMFPFDDVIMRRFDSPVPDCWLLACDFDIFGYVIIKSLNKFSFYLSYFLPLFTVSCMKPVTFF